MFNRAYVFLVAALVAASGCIVEPSDRLCFADGSCIFVEVADEPNARRRGLMHRESIPADHGMLFIFEADGLHGIWMKNMQFPIDLIWADNDSTVVDVKADAPPCRMDPCTIYLPNQTARYVVEVNANYTRKHGIDVGDRLKMPKLSTN